MWVKLIIWYNHWVLMLRRSGLGGNGRVCQEIQFQFQLFFHKDVTFLFQSEEGLKRWKVYSWAKWEVSEVAANMKWRECYSHQFLLSICFITCYGRCYFLSILSLSLSLSLLPVWNIHETNRVSCCRCCPYFHLASIEVVRNSNE